MELDLCLRHLRYITLWHGLCDFVTAIKQPLTTANSQRYDGFGSLRRPRLPPRQLAAWRLWHWRGQGPFLFSLLMTLTLLSFLCFITLQWASQQYSERAVVAQIISEVGTGMDSRVRLGRCSTFLLLLFRWISWSLLTSWYGILRSWFFVLLALFPSSLENLTYTFVVSKLHWLIAFGMRLYLNLLFIMVRLQLSPFVC